MRPGLGVGACVRGASAAGPAEAARCLRHGAFPPGRRGFLSPLVLAMWRYTAATWADWLSCSVGRHGCLHDGATMRGGGRRAAIIGGSMSGLLCALNLSQRGWRVDIFERSPVPLRGRGAGIMTHPEIRAALAAIGIDCSSNFGVPVERRLVLDAAGAPVAERRCPQTATSWNRLFELLIAAFGPLHYHLGKDLKGVEQTTDAVQAQFVDGTSHQAELLVGADGFRSVVRGQFLPEIDPRYAGYVAWRGLAGEGEAVGVLSQALFDSLVFCLPPGEQFLGYPVAGPDNDLRPQHRSWNIVWYRPVEE